MNKVSIVVPVYNVEKYLPKCIDSILSQTYTKLEIILVNDGSIDNSGKICDAYAKGDDRITVIHKENRGVSAARNTGLDKASGKYIAFIDPDDYVENNIIALFVNTYETQDTDLVISNYFSETMKGDTILSQDILEIETKYYQNKSELGNSIVKLWDSQHLMYNLWNKLYSKEIIDRNAIRFPLRNLSEDIYFNMMYLQYVTKMNVIGKPLYHYVRLREGATTDKYRADLFEIKLQENKEFIEHFSSYGLHESQYMELVARRYIERTLGCIENLFRDHCTLNYNEKYVQTKSIILHEDTRKYLNIIKPKSIKIKILLIPYKFKSPLLAMTLIKIVALVKKKLPSVFNKLKNRR